MRRRTALTGEEGGDGGTEVVAGDSGTPAVWKRKRSGCVRRLCGVRTAAAAEAEKRRGSGRDNRLAGAPFATGRVATRRAVGADRAAAATGRREHGGARWQPERTPPPSPGSTAPWVVSRRIRNGRG